MAASWEPPAVSSVRGGNENNVWTLALVGPLRSVSVLYLLLAHKSGGRGGGPVGRKKKKKIPPEKYLIPQWKALKISGVFVYNDVYNNNKTLLWYDCWSICCFFLVSINDWRVHCFCSGGRGEHEGCGARAQGFCVCHNHGGEIRIIIHAAQSDC